MFLWFCSGLITPSGLTSIPTGMETPDMIELRKKKIEDAMEQGAETPQLYQVIPEKKTAVGAAMVGSTHVYDMAPVSLIVLLFVCIHRFRGAFHETSCQ